MRLELEPGATAGSALRASGLLQKHPGLDPGEVVLGMFGSRISAERRLAEGDRVEVLRPLVAEPAEARRRRARPRGA